MTDILMEQQPATLTVKGKEDAGQRNLAIAWGATMLGAALCTIAHFAPSFGVTSVDITQPAEPSIQLNMETGKCYQLHEIAGVSFTGEAQCPADRAYAARSSFAAPKL